jgi:hypothetical protein
MLIATKERLVLPNMLPKKGKETEQIIVRSIVDKVKFSDKEQATLDIREEKGRVVWNDLPSKEVEFSEIELSLLQKAARTLDENGEVDQDNLDVYMKFRYYNVKKE